MAFDGVGWGPYSCGDLIFTINLHQMGKMCLLVLRGPLKSVSFYDPSNCTQTVHFPLKYFKLEVFMFEKVNVSTE